MERRTRALLDRVVRVDRTQLHAWSSLRRALVVGLCVAAGIATDHVALSLTAAFGALMVGTQDRGDSYPMRIRGMLLGLATTTAVVLIASLVSGNAWLHLLAAAPVAFASGLAAAWGPRIGAAGSAALKPFPILSAFALTVPQAFESTLAYIVGGVVQVAVVAVGWALHGSGDARTPVATAWSALAHTATGQARTHDVVALRRAIDHARQAAAGLDAGSRHGRALAQLADEARAIESSLLRTEYRDDGVREPLPRGYLAAVAQACTAVSRAVHSRLFVASARQAVVASTMHGTELGGVDQSRIDHALVDASGALIALHRPEAGQEAAGRAVDAPLFRPGPDLSVHSAVMQEAIRLCAMFTVATAVQLASGNPHGYWIAMTVAVVSTPGYATTMGRTMSRIAGTLAAIVIIAGLGLWVGPVPSVALAAVTAAGAFLYYAGLAANYTVATFGISIFVLMLSSIVHDPIEQSALNRVAATLAGAVILIIGASISPRRSAPHLAARLADYTDAVARYVAAAARGARSDQVAAYAADCRAQHSQVDLTLDEAWAEPGGRGLDPRAGREVLHQVVTVALYGTDIVDGVVSADERDGRATEAALAALSERLRGIDAAGGVVGPGPDPDPDRRRCPGTVAAAAAQDELDRTARQTARPGRTSARPGPRSRPSAGQR